MKDKFRLAVVISHPIQYYYRLYQELARQPEIELMVYYCDEGGTGKPVYDPTFQAEIKWDIPLLEGYPYRFLPNFSPLPFRPGIGFVNPGVVPALTANRYDAVFVWGYDSVTSWLAFLAAAISRTPVFLGGSVVRRPNRPAALRLLKGALLRPLFRWVAAILSECEQNAEYYRFYGAHPERVYWNPAAVDNEYFQGEYARLLPRREEIRAELGIPPARPVILFLGRLDIRKRVVDLLEAYRRLRDRLDASLVFVGEGEQRGELERRIARYGLENVIITGFKNQTELPRYFTAGDVYVLPSEYDPSPRAINEAMNFALPVIVSDGVGSSGDLVRDGENGFVFPTGDINALAGRIHRVLGPPGLRERMGSRSREIIGEWSYRTGAREILRALRALPGRGGSGRREDDYGKD